MPALRQDMIFEIGADGPYPPQFVWQTEDGTPVDVSTADIELVIKIDNESEDDIVTYSTESGHITVEDDTKITIKVPADEVTLSLTTDLTRSGTVTAGVIERDAGDIVVSATGKLAEYSLKITLNSETSFLAYGFVCYARY